MKLTKILSIFTPFLILKDAIAAPIQQASTSSLSKSLLSYNNEPKPLDLYISAFVKHQDIAPSITINKRDTEHNKNDQINSVGTKLDDLINDYSQMQYSRDNAEVFIHKVTEVANGNQQLLARTAAQAYNNNIIHNREDYCALVKPILEHPNNGWAVMQVADQLYHTDGFEHRTINNCSDDVLTMSINF